MSTRQPETVVHLKVGERLFETTVGTLCQGGQNYFSGLFQFEDDESKVIFIDRDGTLFGLSKSDSNSRRHVCHPSQIFAYW